MRRLALILALGLALAACSGGEASDVTVAGEGAGLGAFDARTGSTDAAPAEAPSEGAETSGDGAIAVDIELAQNRMVVRNAQLQLEADDTRAALESIISLTEGAGGFVANATVHPVQNPEDQPAADITLRIPSAQLTEVMDAIKDSVETVVSESQNADDVTEQFVDLEARLTNLEALEVELRALLTEVRQQPEADPDKLLRVFNEIATVRGQIEQIQGQLEYLENVVDLATLTIGLTPTPAVVPIADDTWEPVEVARDALRSLVAGMQGVADWAIHFALYTLPMLLILLGIPAVVGYVAYRQWRKRRPPAAPAAVPNEG
jgi:hypothetical protein